MPKMRADREKEHARDAGGLPPHQALLIAGFAGAVGAGAALAAQWFAPKPAPVHDDGPMRAQFQGLTERFNQLTAAPLVSQADLEALRSNVADCRRQQSTQMTQMDVLRSNQQTESDQLRHLRQDLDRARYDLDDGIKKLNADLIQRHETFEEENVGMIEAFVNEREALRRAHDTLDAKVNDMDAKYGVLDRQVHDLDNSWKLFRPYVTDQLIDARREQDKRMLGPYHRPRARSERAVPARHGAEEQDVESWV